MVQLLMSAYLFLCAHSLTAVDLNSLYQQLIQILEEINLAIPPLERTTLPQTQIMHSLDPVPFNQKIQEFISKTIRYAHENAKIPPKTSDVARIMTYNVHYWNAPDQKDWKRFKQNFANITDIINNIHPDILILQEVREQIPFTGSPTEKFLKQNGYSCIAACNTRKDSWFGNVIASKFPANRMYRYTFKNQSQKDELRCYLIMELMLNNKKIYIYGTHLEVKSPETRKKQMNELLSSVPQKEPNILIAADFNATKEGRTIQLLTKHGYQDSFSKINFTEPQYTNWFGTTIDFIFLSPSWQLPIVGSYIYYSPASDHLPIILDIKV